MIQKMSSSSSRNSDDMQSSSSVPTITPKRKRNTNNSETTERSSKRIRKSSCINISAATTLKSTLRSTQRQSLDIREESAFIDKSTLTVSRRRGKDLNEPIHPKVISPMIADLDFSIPSRHSSVIRYL